MRKRRQVITSGPRPRPPSARPATRPGSRPPARRPGPAAAASPATAATRPSSAVRAPLGPSAADLARVDLSVDLCPRVPGSLVLRNPVMTASGTFGYGVEYGEVVDVQQLGAICCKGTTLEPRPGNRPPRVTETPAGMLNSIGLQNPGVDAVLEKYAALWAGWDVPVIVNVAGYSIEDFTGVARKLDGIPGIAGIELNISCPNVGRGGLQFAVDRDAAAAVTAAVRRATDLPLMVKISPNVTDVRPIAEAIAGAGADALSAINTLAGMAIDPRTRRPLLGNVYGGLSGPAIKPVGLRVVYEIAQVVDIPIVGIGGITTLEDALDYLAVGAVAVQVGTAIFADPEVPIRIIDGLRAYCAERGGLTAICRWSAAPCRPDVSARPPSAPSTGREPAGDAGREPGGPIVTTILPAVEAAARAAIAGRVEARFRESGALRDGHFSLKSGRHSERYLEKFLVLQYPEAVTEICGFLAGLTRAKDGSPLVDVVVGPTTGGVILAFEVARQLGVRGLFAEEVKGADGTARREFRRGFALSPGERVLLVDDILTTGGSLVAMLPPIEEPGAELALAAVIADRSGTLTSVTSPASGRTYPATALWTFELPTYEPGAPTCPACAAGVPLETPGSSGTRAPVAPGAGS